MTHMLSDASVKLDDVVTWLIAGAALAVSICSIWLTREWRAEVDRTAQVGNLHELFYGLLVNKEIAEVRVGGRRLRRLGDAIWQLEQDAKPRNGEDDEQAANRLVASMQSGGWQRAVAREATIALTRVGSLAACGAIPLNYIFSFYAIRIVKNWRWCRAYIDAGLDHSDEPMVARRCPEIEFLRRHGRWIAEVCAVYLRSYWRGANLKTLLQHSGLDQVRSRDAACLRNADPVSVAPHVLRDLARIMNQARVGYREYQVCLGRRNLRVVFSVGPRCDRRNLYTSS